MFDTTPRRRTDEIDPIVPEMTATRADSSATRADGGERTCGPRISADAQSDGGERTSRSRASDGRSEAETAAPLVPDLR